VAVKLSAKGAAALNAAFGVKAFNARPARRHRHGQGRPGAGRLHGGATSLALDPAPLRR
jgi:hypothetical protein